MTIAERVRRNREQILELATKYGARNVRTFGSVARGDADDASDADFIVDLAPERTLFDLGGLQFELETLLHCPVDVVTERGLKQRIRGQVIREAVVV